MSGKRKDAHLRIGILASNRKALRDFHIFEKTEAGIVLTGTEVKSVRQRHVNIQEGYVRVDDHMEAWLVGCTIQPYDHGNIFNHEQQRARKLLLHRREIERLFGKVREKGLTVVPLQLYLVQGKIKISIGLAKGKNVVDKRETIRQRESEHDVRRAIQNHRR